MGCNSLESKQVHVVDQADGVVAVGAKEHTQEDFYMSLLNVYSCACESECCVQS
jgi:hypothetical protein